MFFNEDKRDLFTKKGNFDMKINSFVFYNFLLFSSMFNEIICFHQMFFHRYRISSYDSIRVFLFYFQSESTQCVCILIRIEIKKKNVFTRIRNGKNMILKFPNYISLYETYRFLLSMIL